MENEVKLSFYQKYKNLIWEIFRFLLVGGLATLIDWVVSFFVSAILPEWNLFTWNMKDTLSTICGFTIGLIINYSLSVIFVYKDKKNENSGKSFKDFLVFTFIGVLVLLFQAILIFLVNDLFFVNIFEWKQYFIANLTWGFIIAKVLATGIGLVLNYIFRKIFIFK